MTARILLNAGPSARGFHRLESWMRCPQLYAWGYGCVRSEESSRFPPTEPLVRGSIGHVGLAHLYHRARCIQKGRDSSDHYSPSEAMRLCAESFGELGLAMLPIASRVVAAYAQHYGSEPFEIVAVEEPLETEFLGYRYTARADLIIRDRSSKVWIIDHKFVGRVDSKVYRRYVLSGQFLGLIHLGSRIYGSDFGGIRLNLITTRDPIKFERYTPEPAPWMLQRFPEVVAHAERGIAEVKRLIAEDKIVPACPSEHTCMTSYGECPAYELCRWGESIGSFAPGGD